MVVAWVDVDVNGQWDQNWQGSGEAEPIDCFPSCYQQAPTLRDYDGRFDNANVQVHDDLFGEYNDDQHEPNDDAGGATSPHAGTNTFNCSDLSIHDTTDEDWFAVTAGGVGGTLQVTVSSNGQGEEFDTIVEIYDQTGTTLIQGDDASPDWSDLSQSMAGGKSMLVRVFSTPGAAPWTTGEYQIMLDVPSAPRAGCRLHSVTVAFAARRREWPLGETPMGPPSRAGDAWAWATRSRHRILSSRGTC